MLKRHRRTLLFLALAGVVALAIFAPAPDEPIGLNNEPLSASQARRDAASAERLAGMDERGRTVQSAMPERNILGDAKADLFGSRSWLPPPPKVVVAPPAPVAPPPPPPMVYRFAGRLVQDGIVQFFVSKGDTPVAVKPGANLDGYIVESISANAIALVYPPLDHRQRIIVPPGIPGDAPAVPAGMGSLPTVPPVSVTPPIAQGAVARVQWQGPAQIKLGANFSLALRVMADQPITGSPMQVRYDPSILESVSVRPGKRYAAEAGRGFNYRVNPGGVIVIGASTKAAGGNDPELVVLTFKPKKNGAQAEVSLSSLNLQGPEGRPLAHDVLARFRATVIR